MLNRRLGINDDLINRTNQTIKEKEIKNKIEQPQELKEPEIKEPEIKEPEIKEPPKQKQKNERGAGRKKITSEEIEKRKQLIIKKLSSTSDEKDIEIISDIKNNSSKSDIKEEIKITKKKLKLLSDSLNFVD
jgi:protein phosphatase 1E